MRPYNSRDLRHLIAGELIRNGVNAALADSVAEKVFDHIEDEKIPATSRYGFIYFGQDGFWHWTAEQPVDVNLTNVQVASSWEKFIFNYFGNSSEKLMQFLAVTL